MIGAAFRRLKGIQGQMTLEFAVAFPVFIIVAAIAVNALLFFSECAAFDRIAKEAVRIHAASPAFGQTTEQSIALIEETIQMSFEKDYLTCSVGCAGNILGQTTYTATLDFKPNLFGMGFKDAIFGVPLPSLTHSTSLTVDRYKPGVVI